MGSHKPLRSLETEPVQEIKDDRTPAEILDGIEKLSARPFIIPAEVVRAVRAEVASEAS